MFLSIYAATCRPKNIAPFLDNLTATCNDPTSFEILFKLDEGADDLIAIIEEYKKTSVLNIKYLATPKLGGYYTLEVGYNELLKIADPESYFCWLLTDEIRFETKGWDDILKKYVKFYPDDIFRIKLSIFQLKNYIDFFECLPCPDNYAVTTRKWLEITSGWGNFWGPDSWHQCVDYYLALSKNEFNPFGIWRSFPIYDIKVEGQEAGQGIEDPKKLKERVIKIWQGWQKHSTHAAQENFNKLAQRLNAHIYACAKEINQYIIKENHATKQVSIYPVGSNFPFKSWNYKVPKLRLKILIGYKNINIWHLIPSLYVYRWKFAGAYFFVRRNFIKIPVIIYHAIGHIEKVMKAMLDILIAILKPIEYLGKLLSKLIETLLIIPVYLSKIINQSLFKIKIQLPAPITKTLEKILLVPVNTYKALVVNPIKKLREYFKKSLPLLHPFKFVDTMGSTLRKSLKRKSSQHKTISYLFDGKYLRQLDQP